MASWMRAQGSTKRRRATSSLKNAIRKLLRLDKDCLREHTAPAGGTTGTRRLRDAGDFIELDSWLER